MTNLYEVLYQGDSCFFVQRPDMSYVQHIGVWPWTQWDARDEPVSEVISEAIINTLKALGDDVTHTQWDADGLLLTEDGGDFEESSEAFEQLKTQVDEIGLDAITDLEKIA